MHKTDDGFYGKGVYTSPNAQMSLGYAAGGAVFVCLALPGKQYAANFPADQGKPLRRGYDSHYAPGGQELVFFASDQLLPVFLADAKHIKAATYAAEQAIETIRRKSGSSKSAGTPMPDNAPQTHKPGANGVGMTPEIMAAMLKGGLAGGPGHSSFKFPGLGKMLGGGGGGGGGGGSGGGGGGGGGGGNAEGYAAGSDDEERWTNVFG